MGGIATYLEEKGVRISHRAGWQSVKCVFHGDRDASASFNADRGKFHCFVCGIFEDLIGLLMGQEGMGFEEAKREAAERYGETGSEVAPKSRASRGTLFDGKGDRSTSGGTFSSRRSLD